MLLEHHNVGVICWLNATVLIFSYNTSCDYDKKNNHSYFLLLISGVKHHVPFQFLELK